jgi:hypothetical protein
VLDGTVIGRCMQRHRHGSVNLTSCVQRDAHRAAACAIDYPAVITLLISAQTRNLCILAVLCSAAVT